MCIQELGIKFHFKLDYYNLKQLEYIENFEIQI